MISRVRLVNWRSHEDTLLKFEKGTNVLVGSMGSGKSSVMDAICFALFGTFPALAAKKLSLDDCIMNTPQQKHTARVEVDVGVGEKGYTVIREVALGKGTTTSEVREGGKLLEGPQTKRVTEVVEQKLGVDYELFSRAVYSEQNQMDYFLQLKPGDRKRKIDELLRIERFENARSTLTTVLNRIKDRRKDIEAQVANASPEALKEKRAHEEAELQKLRDEEKKLEAELTVVTHSTKEHDSILRELEAKAKKGTELRERIARLNAQLEANTARAHDIEDKLGPSLSADLSAQSMEAAQQRDAVDAELRKLNEAGKAAAEAKAKSEAAARRERELATREADRQNALKRLKELEGAKPAEMLEEARKALADAERESGAALAEEALYSKRISELEKAGDKCPVCESAITHDKKGELVHDAHKRISEAKEKATAAAKAASPAIIKALEETLREMERLKATAATELGKELDAAKSERIKSEHEAKTLGEAAERASSKSKVLSSERDRLIAIQGELKQAVTLQGEHARIARESAERAQTLGELREQAESLGLDEHALVTAREKARQFSAKEAELKARVDSGKRLALEKAKMVEQLDIQLKDLGSRADEAKAMQDASSSLGVLGSALDHTQVQLREEFTVAINAGLEDVWPRVYPYGDYESCRLAPTEGGYELQLRRRGGEWVNVEGVASGGERSTAALALRIAFSLVLTQNLSWLVLDEPTHNLDSRGVQLVSTALKEHLPGLVEQVFVITHDEQMEQAVSGALYRLERDKAAGAPTKAVLVSTGGE